uniref:Uncharacterized protein n=1 Tax=Avena sativa TaxID=4498 RepID=A0ACD6A958_AVESA
MATLLRGDNATVHEFGKSHCKFASSRRPYFVQESTFVCTSLLWCPVLTSPRARASVQCPLHISSSSSSSSCTAHIQLPTRSTMALRRIFWLLISFLIMAMLVPGSCERARTGSFLIKCYDAAPATTNGTVFRASLLQLLGALPSAAAPTGFAAFASLNTTGHDSVFVRGLCFGDAPAPSECHGCLSVAAKNLTTGCPATTRRAGIWSDGCFLAYADTDYSTPSEDDFRSRVLLGGHVAAPVPDADAAKYSAYRHTEVVAMAHLVALDAAANISGPRMLGTAKETRVYAGWSVTVRSTVRALAQCPRDRTEHECTMCLLESARAVDWDLDAARGDGGVEAAVVGFNCYLRFEVNSSLVSHKTDISGVIVVGGPGTALALLAPLVSLAILRNWH